MVFISIKASRNKRKAKTGSSLLFIIIQAENPRASAVG
ncbi:hypothetical protein IPdc08_01821 [archaeon]|nr:hypothetical protein IPdc08_01821 [archaeon]